MEKIKILVSGCNGHMGQIICRLIDESEDMVVVAGFDKSIRITGFPVLITMRIFLIVILI